MTENKTPEELHASMHTDAEIICDKNSYKVDHTFIDDARAGNTGKYAAIARIEVGKEGGVRLGLHVRLYETAIEDSKFVFRVLPDNVFMKEDGSTVTSSLLLGRPATLEDALLHIMAMLKEVPFEIFPKHFSNQ